MGVGEGGLRTLPKSIAGIVERVQLIVGHQRVANRSQDIQVLAMCCIVAAIVVAVVVAVAAAAVVVAAAAARRTIIVRTA